MKTALALFALALTFSTSTFAAADRDGTPSPKVANRLAFAYAQEKVFADILDHDSSITVKKIGEDASVFLFRVNADNCSVEVTVSKETGMAWNDNAMVCR